MVEFNNLTTAAVNEKFLKRIAEEILEKENQGRADLSIVLVGSGRIRELNKKYRGKNRVTDVLAFPESKVLLENFKVGSLQKIQSLGEIVICLREVKKNAKRFGSSFEKELSACLIHGILHLLGYDHEKNEVEKKKMKEKEEYYLKLFL